MLNDENSPDSAERMTPALFSGGYAVWFEPGGLFQAGIFHGNGLIALSGTYMYLSCSLHFFKKKKKKNCKLWINKTSNLVFLLL